MFLQFHLLANSLWTRLVCILMRCQNREMHREREIGRTEQNPDKFECAIWLSEHVFFPYSSEQFSCNSFTSHHINAQQQGKWQRQKKLRKNVNDTMSGRVVALIRSRSTGHTFITHVCDILYRKYLEELIELLLFALLVFGVFFFVGRTLVHYCIAAACWMMLLSLIFGYCCYAL